MLKEPCWSPAAHTWPCSAAWRTMTVSLLAMMVFRMEMTTMGNTKDMKVLICREAGKDSDQAGVEGTPPCHLPHQMGPGVWKVLGLLGQTGFQPTPGSEGFPDRLPRRQTPLHRAQPTDRAGNKLWCVLAVGKGWARCSQARTQRVMDAVPEPRAVLQDGQAQQPSHIWTVHVWTNRRDLSPAPPTAPQLLEKSFS